MTKTKNLILAITKNRNWTKRQWQKLKILTGQQLKICDKTKYFNWTKTKDLIGQKLRILIGKTIYKYMTKTNNLYGT